MNDDVLAAKKYNLIQDHSEMTILLKQLGSEGEKMIELLDNASIPMALKTKLHQVRKFRNILSHELEGGTPVNERDVDYTASIAQEVIDELSTLLWDAGVEPQTRAVTQERLRVAEEHRWKNEQRAEQAREEKRLQSRLLEASLKLPDRYRTDEQRRLVLEDDRVKYQQYQQRLSDWEKQHRGTLPNPFYPLGNHHWTSPVIVASVAATGLVGISLLIMAIVGFVSTDFTFIYLLIAVVMTVLGYMFLVGVQKQLSVWKTPSEDHRKWAAGSSFAAWLMLWLVSLSAEWLGSFRHLLLPVALLCSAVYLRRTPGPYEQRPMPPHVDPASRQVFQDEGLISESDSKQRSLAQVYQDWKNRPKTVYESPKTVYEYKPVYIATPAPKPMEEKDDQTPNLAGFDFTSDDAVRVASAAMDAMDIVNPYYIDDDD